MMGFGLIFTLLIFGLIAYAIGWRPEILFREKSSEYSLTPLEIIKARYARGEISKEEFQLLLRDLN